MIKAGFSSDGRAIEVRADGEGAIIASKLPGATRSKRMPPGVWRMPLTWDSFTALRGARALATLDLRAEAERLGGAQAYVDMQKDEPDPMPLYAPPMAQGCVMYKHQIRAYNIALALLGRLPGYETDRGGGAALYLDMGLGKSLVGIAVAGRLYQDGLIKRVLVVAPSSVCPVWAAECRRFAGYGYRLELLLGTRDKRLTALKRLMRPGKQLQIAVINYESTWRLGDELRGYDADMVICDESQRIKSHRAAQSKALHKLGDQARYRMVLTGTPMQQDVRDIWSQYRFLAPDIFGSNYYTFQNRYCIFGGYGNHQYLGARHLDELTRRMHSVALRARKEDCLDLPEKTFEERPVLLEDDAAKLYERIRKESYAELASGETVTPNIVLTKLLRLQQIVGGFLTDDDGTTHPVSTAKLDAAAEIIETLCVDEGRKLVIFCRYTAEYKALMERAAKVLGEKLHVVGIRGGVATERRGELVAQFQSDPDTRVFVGNLDACAEGLTLTAADTMLYYSVGWNLGKYLQSQDRIHRIGQQNRCTYIHLIAPGTVDEKIMGALARKEDLARTVVDNWRAVLGGEG